jgi:uncharacterized membrane protein YhaH (DUF805 family)
MKILSLLKSPFSTQGSICKHQYMLSILLFIIGTQLALFIGAQFALGYDSFFLTIPAYHFLIAQGIRRCRAMRKSGWFQFIPFAFVYMLLKQTELDEQKNLAMHIGGASEDMGDACNFCQKHD